MVTYVWLLMVTITNPIHIPIAFTNEHMCETIGSEVKKSQHYNFSYTKIHLVQGDK